MEESKFDDLLRTVAQQTTRRTALGALATVLLTSLSTSARDKDLKRNNDKHKKSKRKHKHKKRKETCWRGAHCQPRMGANLSRCNLAGSTAFAGLNCTGCNISLANLRGVNARGGNFAITNLSGACLIDADFTGATFAATTNLTNAIFCRTIMPDGSVDNSGCGAGTECCASCVPACADKECGADDGCGGRCQTGRCPAGQRCEAGVCRSTCGATVCDPATHYCLEGACLPCDVCAGGCDYSSVAAAIRAQLPSIRVCPGRYFENFSADAAVVIAHPLTLIGAGDGEDPATNTILRAAQVNQTVVQIVNPGLVRLEGLRIMGVTGQSSRGVSFTNNTNVEMHLTIENCTITGNQATDTTGSGLRVDGTNANNARVRLVNTRITRNTGLLAGGVSVSVALLILDAVSQVTDNTAIGQNGAGGIRATNSFIDLRGANNVTGNTPNNCRGVGSSTFNGVGAVCLST